MFHTRCGRSATLPLCDESDPKLVCKRFRMNAKNVAGMIVQWDDGYAFVFTCVELSSLSGESGGFTGKNYYHQDVW